MINQFDARDVAEEHLYHTCISLLEDDMNDVTYYLVTNGAQTLTGDNLVNLEHVFRTYRDTLNQPFDAYEAYVYGTRLPYADRELDLTGALTLQVARLSTATLKEVARTYDAVYAAPAEPLETLGDVLHLVEHRFQFDFATEVLFIEDEEEGEYHIVASESDAAEWLERHARDANLSDDSIASGYWIHRIRRDVGAPRKLWRVVKKRPHVSRRIDVLF